MEPVEMEEKQVKPSMESEIIEDEITDKVVNEIHSFHVNDQSSSPRDSSSGVSDTQNSSKRKLDNHSDEQSLEAKKRKWNDLWQAIEIPPELSKRQRKKYIRKVLWETKWKPEKRAKEKEKLKQKKLQAKLENKPLGPSRNMLKHSTMAKSNCKLRITLDFSFDDLMTEADIGKCLKQLNNCYCLNRRATNPLQLHVTNFSGKAKIQFDKTTPYKNWDVNFHEANHLEVFSKEDLVYLTSDSDNVLSTLDHSKVYVIGALVDHNKYKNHTLEVAIKQGIQHAQLPIGEYLEMKTRKVLTINHVFAIMIHASEGTSWKDALLKVIPPRKGAVEKLSAEGT
ncbi:tRNA methyltransferase 10 homolog A-like isoform X1 [Macrosteles quadrilineatus]|uniref:tRNA methyltransferase 10 homolog A-like isoform X1 n=1 Tax=Macrosteles quadrilineatus TaxID=74068 RepID=UPI0023E1E688|nr:tRNA methyltransferase 10 homolog A-like isoform X1 [Macrosteles quadrilineatus]